MKSNTILVLAADNQLEVSRRRSECVANITITSVESIGRTLVDPPIGAKVPISQVAEVRVDQGPNTINRENVQRRIIVQANVADRDLGSVIEDVRSAINGKVTLPQGYFVQYGGAVRVAGKSIATDHAPYRWSPSPASFSCSTSRQVRHDEDC